MLKSTLTGAAAGLALAAGGSAAEDPAARGRALTDWSSPESLSALAAAAGPELKGVIDQAGGPAGLSRAIAGQIGEEQRVIDEVAVTLNGSTTYQRLAAHERAPAALTTAVWETEGDVLAAQVVAAPRPQEADAPGLRVALPFASPAQGTWFTYWGGPNAARNYHVAAADQRYAYDFLVVREARTYDGDAADPASYFCWGEPVLAPVAGRVAVVVDGIADNAPVGQMNPAQPPGNHVVLEAAPGEYVLVAHLKSGSAAVAAGQRVEAGQPIGACGNSGNSSEPHVHIHAQTSERFGAEDARGLPLAFTDALVDGRPADPAVPIRGQTIAPAR